MSALDPGRALLGVLLQLPAVRVVELVEHVEDDDVGDPAVSVVFGLVRTLACSGTDPAPVVVLAEARRTALASGERVRAAFLGVRDGPVAEADGERRAAGEADRVLSGLGALLVELLHDPPPVALGPYLAAAVVRDARRHRLVRAAQAFDQAARETPDDLVDAVVAREADAVAAVSKRLSMITGGGR